MTATVAFDINDAGTAVGYANKYSGNTFLGQRAVRWDAFTTAATELGTVTSLSDSGAGSLRAVVVAAADSGDIIVFSPRRFSSDDGSGSPRRQSLVPLDEPRAA